MVRGIDRLRSVLSDRELILDARGDFMNVQGFYNQYDEALKKNVFGTFLKNLEKELRYVDETALKIKRIKLRFLENLNSVESKLNTYRKQYKKVSKKNSALNQQVQIIENLLKQIKNIKKRIHNEVSKSIYDERNLLRHI